MRLFLFIFLAIISFQASSIELGTYAGSPIVNDTVAFELLNNSKAKVTKDYFNSNGDRNKSPKKFINGNWIYKEPFLMITYGKFKDYLRIENCPQPNSCFKFEKSEGEKLSPLNVPYGFGLR